MHQVDTMNLSVLDVIQIIEAKISELRAEDKPKLFSCFLHQFLERFCGYLKERSQTSGHASIDEEGPKFIFRVVDGYISNMVKPTPVAPTDWSQTIRGLCPGSCADCASLRAFVESPTQRVMQFAVAEKRRKHLHSKLDGTFVCNTIRSG
ncbi:uncharacterized protein BJX67DRAFT_229657 [Aspergillus lucknowensis]|uniref:Uncharacterized protein n=1 Tax=Aspergillus lucknowensis TaxID=176173 RepID=A0ABR4LIU1_9EURO